MWLSLGIAENHGPEETSPYCLTLLARKFGLIHQTVVPGPSTILPFYILILLPLLECSSNNASCPPDCSLQTWWTKIGEMDSGRCDMYYTNLYGRGRDWTTKQVNLPAAPCSVICWYMIWPTMQGKMKYEHRHKLSTLCLRILELCTVRLKDFTYTLSYLSTEIYKQ